MAEFGDLADNVQSLLYAKLALAIVSEGCTNIGDLAGKRQQDIRVVWSDICRSAGQPVCKIPSTVMAFRI
jgi:hypothetical protein